MTDKNTRLQYILKEAFGNQSKAAEVFGFSRGHISNSVQPGRPITGEIIAALVEHAPTANIDWIYHGRGRPFFTEDYELVSPPAVVNEPQGAYVGLTPDEVSVLRHIVAVVRNFHN